MSDLKHDTVLHVANGSLGLPAPGCAACEIQQIKTDVQDAILERGWAMHYESGGGRDRPVAYTIGRTMRGEPELLISGPFDRELAEHVLGRLQSREVAAGQPLAEAFAQRPGFPITIDPWTAEMYVALAVFGAITALQVLWPDDADRFPGDPDYAVDPTSQRVF